MLRKEDGFTLIELIIVVAIIAILGAIVTPNILKAIESSRVVAAVADSKSIKSAALAYHADTGEWPVSTEQNNGNEGENLGLTGDPEGKPKGWNSPYLDRWPGKNPWGGTYTLVYITKNEGNRDKLYLTLNKVPESAVTKLKDKLGEDIVTEGPENDNGSENYIYIYLAE